MIQNRYEFLFVFLKLFLIYECTFHQQQQAEESLVYEMSRTAPTHDDDQPPIEIMQSDDIDTEISCSSSLDPCTEDYATSQNDECIISDYDQMNECKLKFVFL